MAKIEIERVSKAFDKQQVLKNLSLEIPDGCFFTLLGPSGCGKTTLLRCIAGFIEPDAGRIFFDADEITEVAPHLRNIGIVFQDYALFPDKTVFDNVAYGLRARKLPPDLVKFQTEQILGRVDLIGLALRLPAQLSGGQRQRVALARALVIKPRVLLMDEPLSNLDAKLRLSMRDVIRELQREEKITTIFVTHDQEEALAMSDLIAVMEKGEVAQLGTPEALYERPASAYVADFVGAANVFTVERIERSARQISFGGETLEVDTQDCSATSTLGSLILRPEALSLMAKPLSEGTRCIEISILAKQYLGAKTSYQVAFKDSVIRVDTTSKHAFEVGDTAYLQIPASSRLVD
jgi:iron(III) transport system ATP-binding protein